MSDWSIEIIVDANGKTWFQPDLGGFAPGDALPAQQDDLVSWKNKTNDTHQPWPTDSNYNPLPDSTVRPPSTTQPPPPPEPNYMYPLYMSEPIPAGESSRPAYDVLLQNSTNGTIYYCCLSHPKEITERGTIQVSSVPIIPT